MCALIVLEIAAMWKVFEKAGQPGWAAIIPIYNVIVLIQIAGKPVWWILLYLIPVVSFIIAIIVLHNISVNFGKGVGFTLGLLFLSPIFFPILAWGDAEYRGPAAGSPGPA
ncbi:MAG: signal peptidase I [Gemmatimonadetes bacterium]|nr:MAG: signal peptidase I [Gemmatimonadota bacterium]